MLQLQYTVCCIAKSPPPLLSSPPLHVISEPATHFVCLFALHYETFSPTHDLLQQSNHFHLKKKKEKNGKAQQRLTDSGGRGWVRAFCKFSLLPDVHQLFVCRFLPSHLLVSPPVAGQWSLRGVYILRRWMTADGVVCPLGRTRGNPPKTQLNRICAFQTMQKLIGALSLNW